MKSYLSAYSQVRAIFFRLPFPDGCPLKNKHRRHYHKHPETLTAEKPDSTESNREDDTHVAQEMFLAMCQMSPCRQQALQKIKLPLPLYVPN